MKPVQVRDLAPALAALGILSISHEGKIEPWAKGDRSIHGTGAIEGRWGHSDLYAQIGCEHVAQALVDAGRWTVDAIRAWRASVRREAPTRETRTTPYALSRLPLRGRGSRLEVHTLRVTPELRSIVVRGSGAYRAGGAGDGRGPWMQTS